MGHAFITDRTADTRRFRDLLDRLERRVGGARRLGECAGKTGWSRRGIYFFFESGEVRAGSAVGLRTVRVGTHALKAASRGTLWRCRSRSRPRGPTGPSRARAAANRADPRAGLSHGLRGQAAAGARGTFSHCRAGT